MGAENRLPFEEAVSAFYSMEHRDSVTGQALFYFSAAFCGIVSRYDSRIGRNELVQLFAVQRIDCACTPR